jgi:hypothetical protein
MHPGGLEPSMASSARAWKACHVPMGRKHPPQRTIAFGVIGLGNRIEADPHRSQEKLTTGHLNWRSAKFWNEVVVWAISFSVKH